KRRFPTFFVLVDFRCPAYGEEPLVTSCTVRSNIRRMTNTRRADAWLILCLIVQSVLLTNSLGLLPMLFALLATIALDRLWLKHAPPRVRAWCLALWTLSACLLLYSRMARSYSLQVLGFIVVCWAAWRWSEEFDSWKKLL